MNTGLTTKLSLVGVIAVLAYFAYAATGWNEAQASASQTSSAGSSMDPNKLASVTSLLGGLEVRLAENPDDGKGWLLLAKSYEHLERNEDAIAAYERAAALGVTDEQLLFRLMSSTSSWADTQ